MNVFISIQLTKNDVKFLPIQISLKKVQAKKVDFSTIIITLQKVSRNTVDISTREITPKKVRENKWLFRPSKLHQKKYVDTTWIFSTSQKYLWKRQGFFDQQNYIKKYMEMTWKLVKIWSWMYRHNVVVEMTSIRLGVPVMVFVL